MKRQRTLVKRWCKDNYVTFLKLELEECHSEIREINGTLLDKVRFEDREREEKNEEETV